MYTDDTFLFCSAKVEEINVIQGCLRKYCDWSGQVLNASKSATIFSKNTCSEVKVEINNLLGFDPSRLMIASLGTRFSSLRAAPVTLALWLTKSSRLGFDMQAERIWGLGIKKFLDLNLALISKLCWTFANGDGSVNLPDATSKVACGILASRDFIRCKSCWLVANGRSKDIWHSPWIPWLNWNDYIAAFNPRIQRPRVTLLSNFFNEKGELMANVLVDWFSPHVGRQLGRVDLLSNGDKDRLIWQEFIDGSFSVSQAYLSLIKPRLGDILPCGSRLRTVFGNESHCVLCNDGEDSLLHLFFHCPFAKACWFSSCYGIRSEWMAFCSTSEIVNTRNLLPICVSLCGILEIRSNPCIV
ncbi:hypothetical protein F8388_003114 [Cannabis sativa]|nr:hypothetical protein F8388_003114 [Cannabis sativa]